MTASASWRIPRVVTARRRVAPTEMRRAAREAAPAQLRSRTAYETHAIRSRPLAPIEVLEILRVSLRTAAADRRVDAFALAEPPPSMTRFDTGRAGPSTRTWIRPSSIRGCAGRTGTGLSVRVDTRPGPRRGRRQRSAVRHRSRNDGAPPRRPVRILARRDPATATHRPAVRRRTNARQRVAVAIAGAVEKFEAATRDAGGDSSLMAAPLLVADRRSR